MSQDRIIQHGHIFHDSNRISVNTRHGKGSRYKLTLLTRRSAEPHRQFFLYQVAGAKTLDTWQPK